MPELHNKKSKRIYCISLTRSSIDICSGFSFSVAALYSANYHIVARPCDMVITGQVNKKYLRLRIYQMQSVMETENTFS